MSGAESSRELGIGIVGLGFMGQTHLGAYQRAAEAGFSNKLVAVCDADPERRAGKAPAAGNFDTDAAEELFDPAEVKGYEDPAELFADPAVDVVSICTPTDSHVDLAIAALKAGKHVLVEKPVAVSADEVRRLAAVDAETDTLCMPAMCMRFWPAWAWLCERVREGTYGAVRSAAFQRLGTRPGWGGGFYEDDSRTGGALVDLHIHDADFVRWVFGAPDELRSKARPRTSRPSIDIWMAQRTSSLKAAGITRQALLSRCAMSSSLMRRQPTSTSGVKINSCSRRMVSSKRSA